MAAEHERSKGSVSALKLVITALHGLEPGLQQQEGGLAALR